MTKTITAGSYGKLASFEEHYAFEDRDESGQWAVYSNMFDHGTPKGMVLALGYRFLSKVSDRERLSRLPYVFFALLSASVQGEFCWYSH